MPTCRSLPIAAGLLLAGAFHAQAQVRLSYGPVVGLNALKPQLPAEAPYSFYESSLKAERTYAVQAGLTAEARLGHFSLQPSLIFSQKGGRAHYEMMGNYVSGGTQRGRFTTVNTTDIRLNYLELPLNLVATLGPGRGVQLIAGGYAAYAVGGRVHDRATTTPTATFAEHPPFDFDNNGSINDPADEGYAPKVSRADFGVNFGVGYRLPHWQVQALCAKGLRDYDTPGTYTGGPWRNAAYQFKVAYLLGGEQEHALPAWLRFLRLKPAS